jgi:hypothetical protein
MPSCLSTGVKATALFLDEVLGPFICTCRCFSALTAAFSCHWKKPISQSGKPCHDGGVKGCNLQVERISNRAVASFRNLT